MFSSLRLSLTVLAIALPFAASAAENTAGLYRQAQELMRREQFAAAVPLLEKCVAADPASSKFHQWLGRAIGLQAAQKGITSGALSIRKVKAELEKAIELDPLNLEARQDLAIMYRAVPGFLGGSNAKAAEQVAFIRRHDPAFASQIEGDFLATDKKFDAALSAYNESARLNQRAMIHVRISLVYQHKQEWDKAFAALERALALDANHPLALYQVGRTAALSGQQLDRGEECLRAYIAMPAREDLENPSLAAAHFRLGNIREKKGDVANARAEYETALKMDPKQKLAREALAKLKR
ncbi:MAG TPA: tetratricopeptide repeat protein [Chthoniobacterales bacterium]|jgi:tetratricopeptide (TPR) repeat protein|nr:tetratricopeptide repeat protein [Chthoniobacterales bacterium]